MNKNKHTESLRRKYINRLLSKDGVDDMMPLFTRAMRIFRMVKKGPSKVSGK